MNRPHPTRLWSTAVLIGLSATLAAHGQQSPPISAEGAPALGATADDAAKSAKQADLDNALVKMLSGATLEGSFTNTTTDPSELSREKYTLGQVRKLNDNLWLFPTRIEYGDKDVTLPITVPIEWAGDTPVVVVDNVALPGFGAVSARVMFFADHYAGYWKHGASGGHLFGTIQGDLGTKRDPHAGAKH